MIATVENKLDAIRDALPSEGLFAFKDWLISPDAFPISEKFASELEQLGHRLFVFQRACNQLYQLSVRGNQPNSLSCRGRKFSVTSYRALFGRTLF
jgi:hypothetical protein